MSATGGDSKEPNKDPPTGSKPSSSGAKPALLKDQAKLSVGQVKVNHIQKLLGYGHGPGKLVVDWDPATRDEETKDLLPQTKLRIKRDLKEFFVDPVPDVFLVPDSDNVCAAHAVVVGPADTPYEGGFFYFFVKFPHDYPIRPPRVKLMTTCQDTVRFNPNLYRNGKVCLSILGTWNGPGWSPANNLSSVLLSIQSLMNEKPYHNEPGFEEKSTGSRMSRRFGLSREDPVGQYNDIIRHETLRVAVLNMLDEDNLDTRHMPEALREKIIERFKQKIPHYDKVISDNIQLNGKPMKDPFSEPRGTFVYETLAKKLEDYKIKYQGESVSPEDTAKEYNKIATAHAYAAEEPNFPNANNQDIDSQAVIDDANYYLDEEGTSGEDDDDDCVLIDDSDDD